MRTPRAIVEALLEQSGGAFVVQEGARIEKDLISAAKKIKHCGDYGRLFYHPGKREVHWTAGDADGPPDFTSADEIVKLLKLPGVKHVEIGDEWSPDEAEGWKRLDEVEASNAVNNLLEDDDFDLDIDEIPDETGHCTRNDWFERWVDDKGLSHRDYGPAVTALWNGAQEWWRHGLCHRDDGPAVSSGNGSEWWVNGQRHRVDGPAVKRPGDMEEWYQNGELHRVDGPAQIEANGWTRWYLEGMLHRTGGPAVERPDGTKEWWVNGLRHRDDGPAVERPVGRGRNEWWIDGDRVR